MFDVLPMRPAHPHARFARASHAAALMLLAFCLGAQAQSATHTTRLDPLDPKASVPLLFYVSSLSAPQSTAETPPSWRQANDTVNRIGGWRAYAREAQQANAVAAPPASKTSPPMHIHHERHQPMHHGHRGPKTP
jgi:hypothetical protein